MRPLSQSLRVGLRPSAGAFRPPGLALSDQIPESASVGDIGPARGGLDCALIGVWFKWSLRISTGPGEEIEAQPGAQTKPLISGRIDWRRGAELNRCERFCRPLPNHS